MDVQRIAQHGPRFEPAVDHFSMSALARSPAGAERSGAIFDRARILTFWREIFTGEHPRGPWPGHRVDKTARSSGGGLEIPRLRPLGFNPCRRNCCAPGSPLLRRSAMAQDLTEHLRT